MRKECCVLLVIWIDLRHKLMPWGKHGKPPLTKMHEDRGMNTCTCSGPPAHARFPCFIPSKYRQKIRVTVIILLQSNEAAILFPELILLITEYACMSMYLCVCVCVSINLRVHVPNTDSLSQDYYSLYTWQSDGYPQIEWQQSTKYKQYSIGLVAGLPSL